MNQWKKWLIRLLFVAGSCSMLFEPATCADSMMLHAVKYDAKAQSH